MTQPPLPQSQRKIDAGKIKGKFAISNCVEIRIVFGYAAQTIQDSFFLHGRNPGSVTVDVALANTLLAAIGNSWLSNLGLYMAGETQLGACIVRDMSSPDNPAIVSTGSSFAGTSVSPRLPKDVALVLTENVAVRGRGAKGRIYMPGWATNADATGGVALPAVVTAMTAFGASLFLDIQGTGLAPVVAKPARAAYIGLSGAIHAERPAGMATVLSYKCQDARWDSQRRRDR